MCMSVVWAVRQLPRCHHTGQRWPIPQEEEGGNQGYGWPEEGSAHCKSIFLLFLNNLFLNWQQLCWREEKSFSYRPTKNVFLLVRGVTCYQEVITLIPHPSSRNRHTWLSWYSYVSGELHAWSKFIMLLKCCKVQTSCCYNSCFKLQYFFLHAQNGNNSTYWIMQCTDFLCFLFLFRRSTRCPWRKYAGNSRLILSRWVDDINLSPHEHGLRLFYRHKGISMQTCLSLLNIPIDPLSLFPPGID